MSRCCEFFQRISCFIYIFVLFSWDQCHKWNEYFKFCDYTHFGHYCQLIRIVVLLNMKLEDKKSICTFVEITRVVFRYNLWCSAIFWEISSLIIKNSEKLNATIVLHQFSVKQNPFPLSILRSCFAPSLLIVCNFRRRKIISVTWDFQWVRLLVVLFNL